MEGEGWSGPIVWDDAVFLTAAVPAEIDDVAITKIPINRRHLGRDYRLRVRPIANRLLRISVHHHVLWFALNDYFAVGIES